MVSWSRDIDGSRPRCAARVPPDRRPRGAPAVRPRRAGLGDRWPSAQRSTRRPSAGATYKGSPVAAVALGATELAREYHRPIAAAIDISEVISPIRSICCLRSGTRIRTRRLGLRIGWISRSVPTGPVVYSGTSCASTNALPVTEGERPDVEVVDHVHARDGARRVQIDPSRADIRPAPEIQSRAFRKQRGRDHEPVRARGSMGGTA